MKGTITKRSVDALKPPPPGKREILWDKSLVGFGCLALPSGQKAYIVQYKRAGQSRRVSLGLHGPLTPDQARDAAMAMLGDVTRGRDPIAERKASREMRSFKSVAEEFLQKHVAKCKPSTRRNFGQVFRDHVLPVLGSKPMKEITRGDVRRIHERMEGTPAQANIAVKVISSMWSWASKRDEPGVVAHLNPCHGIDRYTEDPRERSLNDDELLRLADALRTVDADPYAVAAIRILLLTGARLNEILKARWENVDLGKGTLYLPDSKTGAKTIYLGAAAEILAGLERVEGNPYVIVGALPGKPRADLNCPWAAVKKAAGLEGLRIHDLRHNYASTGANMGQGLAILGGLLGHSSAAMTARYAHIDADPKKRAAESIGASINAVMNGDASGEVVPFKKQG
jgi:integrase